MTYEPVTKITDELLAMRWHSDSQARMWFSRRNAAPGRLGLRIVEDDGEFRVEPKERKAAKPQPQPAAPPSLRNDPAYEQWAFEVDALLVDANEPAEKEATLEELYRQQLTAANAAQRIINRRAADLEVATAPAPKSAPSHPAPPVVGDTLADQAAAPTAESAPVIPAANHHSVAGANEVVLSLITTTDMAPIVARRLATITGASVAWAGNRVAASYDDSAGAPRR